MTEFLLIRHAHVSTGSPGPRLQGWFDAPLSRMGLAQIARIVAHGVEWPPPSALYSSTLRRASHTAEALAEAWQLPLLLEPGLREIHCGQLEGQPIEDVTRRYPELWSRHLAQEDDEVTWPGGESYAGLRARVMATITTLAARHPDQRVALVSHAGVINQLVGLSRGRRAADWQTFRPDPLSATVIQWRNGVPRVSRFNSPFA